MAAARAGSERGDDELPRSRQLAGCLAAKQNAPK
jgi:hypothetical protein